MLDTDADAEQKIREIVEPLVQSHASTWKLVRWAIGIAVAIVFSVLILSLTTSVHTATEASKTAKQATAALSTRTPTLQYYACRDRRQALNDEQQHDYDDAKDKKGTDFEGYILAIVDAARNQPPGFDVTAVPTVSAARAQLTTDDTDVATHQAMRDAAQTSWSDATDLKAPAPTDYLSSLTPYATSRCPALPVKD